MIASDAAVDDAAPADRIPPPDEPAPTTAPEPASATDTVAPTEVLLELPAPPSDLRPSLLTRPPTVTPGPEADGLTALDAPLIASAGASLETLRAEALRHLRQEGSWRLVLRALLVLLGVLLAFRLAFDDALPRLLLVIVGGALGLAVLVLLLHHLNETRRQENLLAALAQLTVLARERPELLALLTPNVEGLLTSLRANERVLPSTRPDDPVARALTRAFDDPPSP